MHSVKIHRDILWANAEGECVVRPSTDSEHAENAPPPRSDFAVAWQLAQVQVDDAAFLVAFSMSPLGAFDTSSAAVAHAPIVGLASTEKKGLLFVARDGDGFVEAQLVGDGASARAAAALAAIRYAWSWDESEHFAVSVGAEHFTVTLSYDHKAEAYLVDAASTTSPQNYVHRDHK
ncbi:MAG: hypothetical protein IPK60_07855 [Sandaracinaceae bacterium]|nr:hypothetical protein [Sandaracinaceae bacterium]